MDESTQSTKKSKNNLVVIGLIVIAVIALLGVGGYFYTKSSNKMTVQPTATPNTDATTTPTTPSAPETMASPSTKPSTAVTAKKASAYKNGQYVAIGSYTDPSGPETIKVALTIKNGVVTALTVTPQTTNNTSKKYQGIFASGANVLVVGKNIDEVKLDKVGGSSLTSTGFNEAIDKIKTQAKS